MRKRAGRHRIDCLRERWSTTCRSRHLSLLLSGLSSGSLALPLGVDARSEGILEPQGQDVNDQHLKGQQNTSRLAVEQGASEEAHGRAPVHGRAGDVEGEAGDHLVHQDAKVVAEEGTSDTESPGRGEDEDVATCEERVGSGLDIDRLEQRVGGLLVNGRVVEPVTDKTQPEDGSSERIAGGV